MSLKTNIGGSLKNISSLYANIGGNLKKIKSLYTNENGTLKQIFSTALTGYQWKRYALSFSSTGGSRSMTSSTWRTVSNQFENLGNGNFALVDGGTKVASAIDPLECLVSLSQQATAGTNLYIARGYASSKLTYDTLNASAPYGAYIDTVRSETKDFPTHGGTGEYYYIQKNATFDKYTVAANELTDTGEPIDVFGMYEVSSFQYNPNTKVYDAVVDDTLIDVFGSEFYAVGRAFIQEYTEHPTEIFVCDNAYYDDINVALIFEWTRYYLEYTKGNLVGQVVADADVHPIDGIQDGYWYTLRRTNSAAMARSYVWAEDEEAEETEEDIEQGEN